MSISIKPLEDRIVVQTAEAEQTTASGLVIPDTAKEKPQEGKVVAVVPALVQDGAVLTNGLCSFVPPSTGTASLSFGVEENRGVHAEAGPPVLPLPEGGDRAGQTR